MSDDIVTRLRENMQGCENQNCLGCEIESEAADEIERLRSEMVKLEAEILELNLLWNADKAKLEKLQGYGD